LINNVYRSRRGVGPRGIWMFLATPDGEKKNQQGCGKKENAFDREY
jgi:hypothetical protein